MKRIFIVLLFFSTLSVHAQTDTSATDSIEVQITQLPDSTVIGAPTGKKVSKEIGPAGGSIISEDGKIELVFPANALAKETTVSIQANESIIPNGNKSYHFEPSGIQFKKPVTLIFNYSDEEAAICPPELKFMALQDHNGKWKYLDYTDWDSTSKSLRGSITHFSTMVDGNEIELSATELTLKVGETYRFSLKVVQPPPELPGPGEDELPPLPIILKKKENREVLWKVNKELHGNIRYGKISPSRGKDIYAFYKAPANMTMDPITVTVELNNVIIKQITERAGRRRRIRMGEIKNTEAFFSCNIKLYDEYKVRVIYNYPQKPTTVVDSANFIAIVYPTNVKVREIHNYAPTVGRMPDPPMGKAKVILDASCVGPVNIEREDLSKFVLLKTYPPEIIFKLPEKEELWFKLQYKVGKVDSPVGDMRNSASPHEIRFLAKSQKQTIVSKREPYITFNVEPVRDN